MSDSTGGAVVLTIISILIAIILSYLAFNINYTKAFRMKDYIITQYDEYNGDCKTNSDCINAIKAYADSLGYRPARFLCSDDGELVEHLYCEYEHVKVSEAASHSAYKDVKDKTYYVIETKIDLKIPVVENGLRTKDGSTIGVFKVTGNTKAYEKE